MVPSLLTDAGSSEYDLRQLSIRPADVDNTQRTDCPNSMGQFVCGITLNCLALCPVAAATASSLDLKLPGSACRACSPTVTGTCGTRADISSSAAASSLDLKLPGSACRACSPTVTGTCDTRADISSSVVSDYYNRLSP